MRERPDDMIVVATELKCLVAIDLIEATTDPAEKLTVTYTDEARRSFQPKLDSTRKVVAQAPNECGA